ncbi:MAG: hypothetical protein P8Y22_04335 [Sulfurimonas sp.]
MVIVAEVVVLAVVALAVIAAEAEASAAVEHRGVGNGVFSNTRRTK